MTKKRSSEILGVKMEIFSGKNRHPEILVCEKFFRPPPNSAPGLHPWKRPYKFVHRQLQYLMNTVWTNNTENKAIDQHWGSVQCKIMQTAVEKQPMFKFPYNKLEIQLQRLSGTEWGENVWWIVINRIFMQAEVLHVCTRIITYKVEHSWDNQQFYNVFSEC